MNKNEKVGEKISGLQNGVIRGLQTELVLGITIAARGIINRGSFRDFKSEQKDYKSEQRFQTRAKRFQITAERKKK